MPAGPSPTTTTGRPRRATGKRGGRGVSTGGSVHVQGGSTFAALLAIGILAGASYASDREYESSGMQRRSSPFTPMQRSGAVPELDAARTVNEQDCTKPIVDWSANLKCK